MNVVVCNPLLRTPLSLIVDDSCPVVNLTYYWIHQRHAWKARHQPNVPPDRWEGDAVQLQKMPPTIPADFAWEWAEWCAENGVKGKFSLIPYPAGVGRVDEGFPDFPIPGISGMAANLPRNYLAQLRFDPGDAHPHRCRRFRHLCPH